MLFKKNTNTEPVQEETKAQPVELVQPETVVCKNCKRELDKKRVVKNKYVCYECGYYFRVRAKNRIRMVTDAESFTEWDENVEVKNPLNFPEYEEKVAATQEKTGLKEGVTVGKCRIYGEETVLGVIDARFMMGSMGHVVGEKITHAFERATEEKLPVILFCCSGGARMQEGMISLMQMAKTSAALKRHSDAGLLYVSVLTDPTTGGVTASWAMLGDIILAEPHALIGFAGPRVIEQTIGQKLPKGFQRAEFLVEHGFVDRILPREEAKEVLAEILRMHGKRAEGMASGGGDLMKNSVPEENGKELQKEETAAESVKALAEETENTETSRDGQEKSLQGEKEETEWENLRKSSAWDCVQKARKKDRPVGGDYIRELFPDFIEFHGDRLYGDDAAIIGGIASFDGTPVTVIAEAKGADTKENIRRNFGMPSPEGYRKALRLMKQAEKFHRPVICLVDTPGAFCGMEAEERGQGEAIARNLYEMSALKTPVLSIVISEGGSGGALALAVADEVWMMQNAIYSILSPEGFASILWKDGKRAPEAAEVMKLTAGDLKELGIVE